MSTDPVILTDTDPLFRLLQKLRARDDISAEEEDALRGSIAEFRDIRDGCTIIKAGKLLEESTLLIRGIVARHKDLVDGQRQIMEIHLPGDFLDLHSFLLKQLEHDVSALTDVKIAIFPHAALRKITETQPHLSRMLWLSTLLDAAIHRERILSIGRRTAIARVAHLLCEIYARLEAVSIASDHQCQFPLRQTDIADANGLTSVHVNRMLKKLRDEKLATFRSGRLHIHDWERLKDVAEFSEEYLHLEFRPR